MYMDVRKYHNEIKQYCIDNKLSFDKTMSAIKGCGSDSIFFQIPLKTETSQGLLSETPLPTVLIIKKKANGIEFEQTKHTQKYLAM